MIDLNSLKQFTELQQEQVKESILNTASIAEIIGVLGMSDIVEKGDGYIRFENGIQICFGEFNITGSWNEQNKQNINENVIFSKEFISKPIVTTNNDGAGGRWSSSALNITNSNFDFSLGLTHNSHSHTGTAMCQYFAFGFWREI
jgi:hypothetical protein